MSKFSFDYIFKILLIGDSGVGKTSILKRYSDDVYEKDSSSTVGIDFKIRTIEMNGIKIKLQMWDTAGQERFRNITTAYYRNALGVIIVFDITNRTSFENVEYWISNVKDNNPRRCEIVLVGDKSDLRYTQNITQQEIDELVAKYGMRYFETSAKQDYMIDDVFKYLTHTIKKNIDEEINDNNDNNNEPSRSRSKGQNENIDETGSYWDKINSGLSDLSSGIVNLYSSSNGSNSDYRKWWNRCF